MKVYRILRNTEGTKFIVQREGWFGSWVTEGNGGGGYSRFQPHEFATWDAAQSWIDQRNTPPKPDVWTVF